MLGSVARAFAAMSRSRAHSDVCILILGGEDLSTSGMSWNEDHRSR